MKCPELLDPSLDELLAELSQSCLRQERSALAALVDQRRLFLARCRDVGVEQAYLVHSLDVGADAPAELRDQLQALSQRRHTDYQERIDLYPRALALLDREKHPYLWGVLQFEYGECLHRGPQGDEQANQELAIAALRFSLAVRSKTLTPFEWAQSWIGLAEVYLRRRAGTAADNLALAILAYDEALAALSRERHPARWAHASSQLARVYLERVHGDQAENVEAAIRLYEAAQQTGDSRGADPLVAADTAKNLAEAYVQRIHGDPEENLAHALLLVHEAFTTFREHEHLEEMADSAQLLVHVLRRFPSDVRMATAQQSTFALIEECRASLPPDKLPLAWATVTKSLASLHADPSYAVGDEGTEKAIVLYQQALAVYERTTKRMECARIQTRLADLYLIRQRGSQLENVERSIGLLQGTLELLRKESEPQFWADAIQLLGAAYAARKAGELGENRRRAIELWRQALEIYDEKAFPMVHAELAEQLGTISVELGQIEEAHGWFQRALRVLARSYQHTALLAGKSAVGRTAGQRYHRIAQGLVQAQSLSEAAVSLERSRSEGLGDTLIREQTDFAQLPELTGAAYSQCLRAALWLRQLEAQQLGIHANRIGVQARASLEIMRAQTQRARDQLNAAVERIRVLPEHSDFLREAEWPDCAAAVVPATAGLHTVQLPPPVIYLAPLREGVLALLLRPATAVADVMAEALWLDGFDEHAARGYLAEVESGPAPAVDAALEKLLSLLGERLMAPLAERLRGAFDSVVLIPCEGLGRLPLHAAVYEQDGRQQAFLDEFAVSYAPSARALLRARAAASARGRARRLGGVANPLPHGRPLLSARNELEAVAPHFPSASRHLLFEDAATHSAVLAMLPQVSHVHLCCQSQWSAAEPLNSALEMAHEEPLTLYDLLAQDALEAVRLVVLSTAQAPLVDPSSAGELPGWPAAFLRLGVPGAVGALWPTQGDPTALLMRKFYELLLKEDAAHGGSVDPARALQGAQRWLRSVSRQEAEQLLPARTGRGEAAESFSGPHPFGAPRHWAAFVAYGT